MRITQQVNGFGLSAHYGTSADGPLIERSIGMLNTQFTEMRMFKQVPGGFIFQLPRPTIFTPTEAVLVTASQREEILSITRKGSTMARRVFVWGSVVVGIFVGHETSRIEDMPALVSFFLGFC